VQFAVLDIVHAFAHTPHRESAETDVLEVFARFRRLLPEVLEECGPQSFLPEQEHQLGRRLDWGLQQVQHSSD